MTLMNSTGQAAGRAATDPLSSLAEANYAVALDALCDTELWLSYRAVAQLSGHLAVIRRVVCPAASGQLGQGQPLVAACRAEARQAEWALRLLESWLAGDAHALRFPAESMQEMLAERLGSYRAAERALLTGLADLMPQAEHARIAQRYRVLFAAAPTRPHPRSPRAGLPGRLAFRFQGIWDRVLDTTDCRPGPVPAVPAGSMAR